MSATTRAGAVATCLACFLGATNFGPVPLASEMPPAARSGLAALLSDPEETGFTRAIAPRRFEFPRDHGPHPEFRNEWWYMTGNLETGTGRRFGFELTIFRFSLTPRPPEQDSGWRTNQVYIAHFAVTDAERERFLVAQRYSRGALGLAGAQPDPFRVWVGDWSIEGTQAGPEMRWQLNARDEQFALELTLDAQRPVVLNGVDGLSRKSAEPGNASYYYSVTRWASEGRLRIEGEEFRVSGLAWLDREWGSSALASDQQGWDWFALQLSDGRDLMFYSLRKQDGSQDENSAGTLVSANGSARYLSRESLEIFVEDYWDSPAGGAYPSKWRLRLPAENLSLSVKPVIANQELFTTVRYWEGAVDISGTHKGQPITGRGYVELTGYAP